MMCADVPCKFTVLNTSVELHYTSCIILQLINGILAWVCCFYIDDGFLKVSGYSYATQIEMAQICIVPYFHGFFTFVREDTFSVRRLSVVRMSADGDWRWSLT